jgi:hypothetical protein
LSPKFPRYRAEVAAACAANRVTAVAHFRKQLVEQFSKIFVHGFARCRVLHLAARFGLRLLEMDG